MLFEASKKMPDKDNNSETASVDAEAVADKKVETEKDIVIKADEGDGKPSKTGDNSLSDTNETDDKTKELSTKSSPLRLPTKELLDKDENQSDTKITDPEKSHKTNITEGNDSENGDKKEKNSQKSGKKKTTSKEDSADNSKQEISSKGQKRKASADEESDADDENKDDEEEEPKKKSRKRAHSEEKAEDEKESEDEEEELKPGLLEQPVVLEEGLKREKKKVQRLELTPPSASRDKKVDIPEGSGEKLGDIPRIEFQLNKVLSDDLRPLHRLLYFRAGTTSEVKRNIRRFSGFSFAKNSAEFKKKIDQLNKMTATGLKSICEVLDLERGGKKEDLVDRMINFLMKPKSSGKVLPKPKKKRSSTGEKSSKKSKTPKKKAEKRKSRTKKSESEDEDTDGDDEEEEEKEEEHEEEPEEEEEEKEESSDEDFNAKRKKKSSKTPVKKTPKKGSKAEENRSKSAAKDEKTKKKTPVSKKRPRYSESEDSSDEEVLKKPKTEPTNEELKEVVKKILEGANLEEVTMKTVYKQVFEKYPDFDLSSRKDFIKAAVKQIIK